MSDLIVKPQSLGKIIREYTPFKITQRENIMVEDVNNRGQKIKVMRLSGLVQKMDTPNENMRVYETPVMREAVEALQPGIKGRTVLGELDHPDDAKIHTENTCILLTKLFCEGKNVYGQFEVLEGMPKGQMLKALINQGVTVSISSRGVGDMESCFNEGLEYNRVLPGFRFVTFDAVNEPSVQGTALSITESKKLALAESRKQLEKEILKATREILG